MLFNDSGEKGICRKNIWLVIMQNNNVPIDIITTGYCLNMLLFKLL